MNFNEYMIVTVVTAFKQLQLLKLQLPLRRSYLHLNLFWGLSGHAHKNSYRRVPSKSNLLSLDVRI